MVKKGATSLVSNFADVVSPIAKQKITTYQRNGPTCCTMGEHLFVAVELQIESLEGT